MSDENKSLDVFGVKPIADAAKTVVDSTMAGIGAVLSRICLPAAEEFGLAWRDRVSAWRMRNLARIMAKTQETLRERVEPCHAPPRLVALAIEQGSWAEDDEVQARWAGLIASSCTTDGKDESNLLFMNLLSQLSASQVRVLSFACARTPKFETRNGLIIPDELTTTVEEVIRVSGIGDLHRLDRELDHLRSLELLVEGTGFHAYFDVEDITLTPSALALHLYVRSHGFVGPPTEFFQSEIKPYPYEKEYFRDLAKKTCNKAESPKRWWKFWSRRKHAPSNSG